MSVDNVMWVFVRRLSQTWRCSPLETLRGSTSAGVRSWGGSHTTLMWSNLWYGHSLLTLLLSLLTQLTFILFLFSTILTVLNGGFKIKDKLCNVQKSVFLFLTVFLRQHSILYNSTPALFRYLSLSYTFKLYISVA